MPDINDLLRDAAPGAGAYDEDDVRRRVTRRRRTRRAAVTALVVLVVLGMSGAFLALRGDDDRAVVADASTTITTAVPGHYAAFGSTSVAIVGDEVWTGGDGFVSRGDGSDRVEVPGGVEALAAGDPGLLWVRGDDFVAAVDTAKRSVVGTWDGVAADLVPLPSGEVAISVPSSSEVAIVRTAAEGL